MEPKRRRATYEDLLAVPEPLVAELLDGELHTRPRPSPKHALASSSIGVHVGGPFGHGVGGPGGWWILDEPELHLGEDVLVPDLAGWRRERLPHMPETPYFELAPDWICEVLSPSSAARDRVAKLAIYARARVLHAWLVDPEVRTLEVLRLAEEGWLRVAAHEGDARVRAEPFSEVELSLTDWWDVAE